jgi:hypothetical protein
MKMDSDFDISWLTFWAGIAIFIAIPVGIDVVWRLRKTAIIADLNGLVTLDKTRHNYSLLRTVQSIPNTNGKTAEIHLLSDAEPLVLCHHVPLKDSEMFVTLLRNLGEVSYHQITHIVFGEFPTTLEEASATLQCPDMSRLMLPLYRLRQVCIHLETCKSLKIEQFLTYAVNLLGRMYLKHEVEVVLHGPPAMLQPHLHNALNNLCKAVTWQSDLSTRPIKPRGIDIEKQTNRDGQIYFLLPKRHESDTKSLFVMSSCMLIVSLASMIYGVTSANPKAFGLAIMSIPIGLLFGIMWSVSCVKLFRRIRLTLTPEWIVLQYTLLGIEYTRRLPIRSLHVDTYAPKWSRGISLHAGKRTWRFGFHLTAAECIWLVREICEYVAQVQSY